MQNFDFKIEGNKIILLEYLGNDEIVVIPEKFKGKPIKKVSSMCFFSKEKLKEVYFPKTVSNIEHNAFVDCPNLKVIEVNNIRDLGNIFEDCPKELKIISSCMTNINRFKKMFSDYDLKIYNPKNFIIRVVNESSKKAKIIGVKQHFKNVVIPDKIDGYKIVEIVSEVYQENRLIETIELPEYLEIINKQQFEHCSNLKEVNIKKNVKTIREHAFLFCNSLSRLELPSSLMQIEDFAFAGTSIESIILSNNVKKIGKYAFSSTKKLKTVVLNDSLEQIGEYCFYESSIQEILLPKNITTIQKGCFCNCINLRLFGTRGTITRVENEAFYNCKNLEITKNFIESLNSIGCASFGYCLLPEEVVLEKPLFLENMALSYTDGIKILEIKNSTGLTELPDCFLQKSTVEKVTLDSNIFKLGHRCFNSSNISEINLNYISILESQVFLQCNSLEKIIIPDNLLSIPKETFASCENLNLVLFSKKSKVKVFEEDSFKYTTSLKKITCPHDLEIIKKRCFYGSGISEIELNRNFNIIEEKAFYQTSLREFIVPKSMKSIAKSLFSYSNIESIVLHEDIEDIGVECFYKATNLKYVHNLEKTKLKDLKESVFSGCKKLKHFKLPETLTKISAKAFLGCSNLEEIEIPDNVVMIDSNAFYQARIEEKLTFGKSELTINYGAFKYCTLPKKIVIPENVIAIKDYAFSCNDGLEDLDLKVCHPMNLGLYNFEGSCIKNINISDSKIRAKIKNRKFFKENSITINK